MYIWSFRSVKRNLHGCLRVLSGPQTAKKFGGGQSHFQQRLWRHRCAVNHDATFLLRSAYQHWWRNLFHRPWASGGGAKWAFSPAANRLTNQICHKTWSQQFNSDTNWNNSCNNILFTGMRLTLHKRQLHCFGITPWWAAYGSLMSAHLPAEADCETWERIVLLLDFIA